jgi:hypothetical protein
VRTLQFSNVLEPHSRASPLRCIMYIRPAPPSPHITLLCVVPWEGQTPDSIDYSLFLCLTSRTSIATYNVASCKKIKSPKCLETGTRSSINSPKGLGIGTKLTNQQPRKVSKWETGTSFTKLSCRYPVRRRRWHKAILITSPRLLDSTTPYRRSSSISRCQVARY